MARLIKDQSVIEDQWTLVARDATTVPAGSQLLLPYTLWQTAQTTVANRQDIGVWFDSDQLPDLAEQARLQALPLIAVHFPVFTDGRGFSIGRLLRERMAFSGELRAFGYVLRDQLCYLKRCGFNSFVLQDHVDANEALSSLDDFTEYYQSCVNQPLPLFRRA